MMIVQSPVASEANCKLAPAHGEMANCRPLVGLPTTLLLTCIGFIGLPTALLLTGVPVLRHLLFESVMTFHILLGLADKGVLFPAIPAAGDTMLQELSCRGHPAIPAIGETIAFELSRGRPSGRDAADGEAPTASVPFSLMAAVCVATDTWPTSEGTSEGTDREGSVAARFAGD
jgi:hypothetical protein